MITRRFIGIIAIVTAALPSVGQTSDPAAPGKKLPLLKVDSDAFDFGVLRLGQEARHPFVLTNAGNAPLEILEATPGPGCGLPDGFPKKIDVGQSARLTVSVDTVDTAGKFDRSVTLKTNDAVQPVVHLRLVGQCRPPLEARPRVISFGKIISDQPQHESVTITNHADESVRVTLATPSDDKFSYELVETVPGAEFKLFVTIKPPYFPGRIAQEAVLKTSFGVQPEMKIRVLGFVPPRLEITPPAIFLGNEKRQPLSDKGVTKVLLFSNNGASPVHLQKLESDDPRLTLSQSTIIEGKAYRILVQFPPDYQQPPGTTAVSLHTDDPYQSVVRVPVHGGARLAAAPQPTPEPPEEQKFHATDPKRPAVEDRIGRVAPAFELTTTEGVGVTNADLAKAVTVMNFFTPGDYHNYEQLTKLEMVRREFSPRGVRFIHVSERHANSDVTQEDQVQMLKDANVAGEVSFDLGNNAARAFNLSFYPTTVILNRAGQIEAVHAGNLDDLQALVKKDLEVLVAGGTLIPGPDEKLKRRRPALTLAGKPTPKFTIHIENDETLTDAQLADYPATVLNFVAPNCGFCRRQIPKVEAVRQAFAERGVKFVNVIQTMRKSFTIDEIHNVMSSLGSYIEIAPDPKNEVGRIFKARSFPTMMVLRRDGTIAYVNIGAKGDMTERLTGQLEEILQADASTTQ